MNTFLSEIRETIMPGRGGEFGPLPPLLLTMTIVTGLVDSFSYLTLGHVFVANMTGNVVLLAFALIGAKGFSIPGSLARPRGVRRRRVDRRACVFEAGPGPGQAPLDLHDDPSGVPRRVGAVEDLERDAGDRGFPLRLDRRARRRHGDPECGRPQAGRARHHHHGPHDDDHRHRGRRSPRREDRGQSGAPRAHDRRHARGRASWGRHSSCTPSRSIHSPSP